MTIHPCYVGCDVSKRVLDLYDPASGRTFRLANDAAGTADLTGRLAGRDVIVVLEATGGYDRALRAGLAAAGIARVRVNPVRARRFAQATGLLAKTDAIDARLLSRLGESLKLAADQAEEPERKALDGLQKRRDQLVRIRADETKRAHLAEAAIAASIEEHVAWLNRAIAELDATIEAFIAACEPLKQARAKLMSAPGIGPVSANVLLAQMAELGRLGPKQIASLAGLAPFNHDSGARRGSRHIAAGRRRVRQALYMAALAAIRSSTRFNAFYQRILSRAKAAKVAIIATARKLLTILNAMIRDNRNYRHSCA